MRYVGGKGNMGAKIAPFLSAELLKTGGRYLEPFTGGANILYRLVNVKRAICGDAHPGVIALYNAVLDGWVPPSEVSEDVYRFLRNNRDNGALSTFVAFASSFGGVEWTDYSRQAGRNPTAEGKRAVIKKILGRNSDRVRYVNANYDWHSMRARHVVYCDPPYRGVNLYSTPDFDNDRFEHWCELISSLGHSVFVSEYTAPKHWDILWSSEQPTKNTGNKKAKAPGQVDRLYRVRLKK